MGEGASGGRGGGGVDIDDGVSAGYLGGTLLTCAWLNEGKGVEMIWHVCVR